ncbi:MAG: flagellar basal body-associated protein FliL [Verrucomicrobia bacterium]|nr:flagellar basal body-associated protein FliL [Verrucomicrobiota bacterium]
MLVIRHAEKPASGADLSPAGEARAKAYVAYFKNFTVDGNAMVPEQLFACSDSKASCRPRQTLVPLSDALGLKIDVRFSDEQSDKLAGELQAKEHKKCILISWHHSYIPALLKALGADPAKLLPKGKWPDPVFGWVIQLRFDKEGKLIPSEAKRINEGLMPDDSK